MPVSTRSCSPALVLVLAASLSLAATDARGQSQFVTVRFQGHVTSVEVYDANGCMFIQFFGKRKEGVDERKEWREIAERLPRHESAAA